MPTRSFFRRPAVVLALALCAVAAVVSLLGKLAGGGSSTLKAVALVGGGAAADPGFSPDGKFLVYSGRHGKGPFHLYVRPLPGGAPSQLTNAAESDFSPAWSPDGATIAFIRDGDNGAECMVIPASGGEERRLAACGGPSDNEAFLPALAWMPDSKALIAAAPFGESATTRRAAKLATNAAASSKRDEDEAETAAPGQVFALMMIPLDGSAPRRLAEPPREGRGDFSPVVSPDGSTLAFVRDPGQDDPDIFVLDLPGGKPRQLTFEGHGIRGLAWTPDSRDLIFSGQRGPGGWRLWRIPASGGSPRDLVVAGRRAQFPAVARSGGRLAYTQNTSAGAIWRSPLGDDPDAGTAVIRATGRVTSPAWSHDGSKIAFISDESGADEIWISDADGGNRRRVTHFANNTRPSNPRWSPDGSKLLAQMSGLGEPVIYVVPLGGGQPKRLLTGMFGSWSHDGASVYYSQSGGIWKAPVGGGEPSRLTRSRAGGMMPEESADGKYVYYRQWRSIWRVPSAGGVEEEFIQPQGNMTWSALQPVANGAYYVERDRNKRMLVFYDFASRKSTPVFTPKPGDGDFSVAPDGKSVLHSRVDQNETTLMLIENFK